MNLVIHEKISLKIGWFIFFFSKLFKLFVKGCGKSPLKFLVKLFNRISLKFIFKSFDVILETETRKIENVKNGAKEVHKIFVGYLTFTIIISVLH